MTMRLPTNLLPGQNNLHLLRSKSLQIQPPSLALPRSEAMLHRADFASSRSHPLPLHGSFLLHQQQVEQQPGLKQQLLLQLHQQQQFRQLRQLQQQDLLQLLHQHQQQQELRHLHQLQKQFLAQIDIPDLLTSTASSITIPKQPPNPLFSQQQQQVDIVDPPSLLNSGVMPLKQSEMQQPQSSPVFPLSSCVFPVPGNPITRASNMTQPSPPKPMSKSPIPAIPNRNSILLAPILAREYGRVEPMSSSSDKSSISEFQCRARDQIEFFEALGRDVTQGARGRNVPITLGQVGIRCRHCRDESPSTRGRAAVYFPTKYELIYQTAVNMISIHLCQQCTKIPENVRDELLDLRDQRSTTGGGKIYWGNAAKALGVIETVQGLRFNE
jgi:hypothetical protein